jgi:hypothetical protein
MEKDGQGDSFSRSIMNLVHLVASGNCLSFLLIEILCAFTLMSKSS